MAVKPRQEVLRLDQRPVLSATCWIETDSHRQIRTLCAEVIEKADVLWLYGPSGVGKTHLALQLQSAQPIDYFDCAEIPPPDAQVLFDSLDVDRAVILDSIDCWLGPAGAEEALFSWWKRRLAAVVCIAPVSARKADLFCLPDLASRALASHLVALEPLSDEDITALWRCLLAEYGLELGPEVLRFLAPRLPRNPGRVVQLVQAMDQESLRDQRKITIPWLKQLLLSLS